MISAISRPMFLHHKTSSFEVGLGSVSGQGPIRRGFIDSTTLSAKNMLMKADIAIQSAILRSLETRVLGEYSTSWSNARHPDRVRLRLLCQLGTDLHD